MTLEEKLCAAAKLTPHGGIAVGLTGEKARAEGSGPWFAGEAWGGNASSGDSIESAVDAYLRMMRDATLTNAERLEAEALRASARAAELRDAAGKIPA